MGANLAPLDLPSAPASTQHKPDMRHFGLTIFYKTHKFNMKLAG
jgi:hypothetical protein